MVCSKLPPNVRKIWRSALIKERQERASLACSTQALQHALAVQSETSPWLGDGIQIREERCCSSRKDLESIAVSQFSLWGFA